MFPFKHHLSVVQSLDPDISQALQLLSQPVPLLVGVQAGVVSQGVQLLAGEGVHMVTKTHLHLFYSFTSFYNTLHIMTTDILL